MYNVQMYNVQKCNVQKDNVLNMSGVLGVILTFFFVGPGAAQRRRSSSIFSDPMDFKVFMQTPRLSPDRGEQNGREKNVAIFAPGAEKK